MTGETQRGGYNEQGRPRVLRVPSEVVREDQPGGSLGDAPGSSTASGRPDAGPTPGRKWSWDNVKSTTSNWTADKLSDAAEKATDARQKVREASAGARNAAVNDAGRAKDSIVKRFRDHPVRTTGEAAGIGVLSVSAFLAVRTGDMIRDASGVGNPPAAESAAPGTAAATGSGDSGPRREDAVDCEYSGMGRREFACPDPDNGGRILGYVNEGAEDSTIFAQSEYGRNPRPARGITSDADLRDGSADLPVFSRSTQDQVGTIYVDKNADGSRNPYRVRIAPSDPAPGER